MNIQDKILSAWYGQALGDSMGMPGELWHIDHLRKEIGVIDRLLPGHPNNIASIGFEVGEFTDDTSCAIAISESLIEHKGEVISEAIGQKILEWALSIDAFNKNILGPSSKASLTAIKDGVEISKLENMGITNGAVMRILPIACVYSTKNLEILFNSVESACIPTHKADIAIAGACVIAWAISSAIDGRSWEYIKKHLFSIAEESQKRGTQTFSPSLGRRINYTLKFCQYLDSQQNIDIEKELFEEIGVGMNVIETVPAVFAIVELANTNPIIAALLSSNLGGDTDTIGALATAICGALHNSSDFNLKDIQFIENVNKISFSKISEQLSILRK